VAGLWQGARSLSDALGHSGSAGFGDTSPAPSGKQFIDGVCALIKAEWGTKRQCPKCSERFYDLQKADPVTCISCGHSWMPEPILKSKQTLPFEVAKAEGEAKVADPALESDDDLDIDADSDEPAEDTDVHIGDGDDLSEVVVTDREEER